MSYRCGIGVSLAAAMGVDPGPPRVKCDGCGVVLSIRDDRLPPKWLLDGKAAPGWTLTRHDDGTRDDRCPNCRVPRATKRKAVRK